MQRNAAPSYIQTAKSHSPPPLLDISLVDPNFQGEEGPKITSSFFCQCMTFSPVLSYTARWASRENAAP